MLLEVKGLVKHFPIKKGLLSQTVEYVHAVDSVNLFMDSGETLGLVGESGCGKTTIARLILRLIEPNAGQIFFDGCDICKLKSKEMLRMRRRMQIVFQDPFSSLDPRMTINKIIKEPLKVHNPTDGFDRKIVEILEKVGLDRRFTDRFPYELSGGQRQRVAIARALIVRPDLLALDEPTAALDVSVQAQILNLLKELQREFGVSYLFISHDLSVIYHISNRISVMYLGKIVETGPKNVICLSPIHPYTRALISANPLPSSRSKISPIILKGDVPSPVNLPSGCRFHPRCPTYARSRESICIREEPKLVTVEPNHDVACHLAL